MGKRTDMDQFTKQSRGGYGKICYKINEKTGNIVGVKAVTDEHEFMLINSEGIIIQLAASQLRKMGKYASGVRLMNLDEGVKVVSIAKVRGDDTDEISEEDPAEETGAAETETEAGE